MANISPASQPSCSLLEKFETAVTENKDAQHLLVSDELITSGSFESVAGIEHQKTKTAFRQALLEKYPEQKKVVNQLSLFNTTSDEPLSISTFKQIKAEIEKEARENPNSTVGQNTTEPLAEAIVEIQKVDEKNNHPEQPAPTRAWGIPISEEQAKRLATLAALTQGSVGLLKGGALLGALGVTGGLLAVPVGILVFNHFANKSHEGSLTLEATPSPSTEKDRPSSPSFTFEGHHVAVMDSASKEAEEYTKHAWNIVGLGFAAQLEGQFLHALLAAHVSVTASPAALLVAGTWVAGFAKGIASFNRTNFTTEQHADSISKNNSTLIEHE